MTRTRLDREAVLLAAEALVDRNGWAYLTMTGLAEQLGVRAPSLYSHVDGVEALLGAIQARAIHALGLELQRAAMGTTGRDGFRALAAAQRAFALGHPGRYELAMSEPIDAPAVVDASRPAGAALAAVLRSFGVSMTNELAFTCLALLHGVLTLERAGLFRGSEVRVDVDAAYATAVDSALGVIERRAADASKSDMRATSR